MVFSPGTVAVTLLSPASATLAADLGLTSGQNVQGAVLHLPARDAAALVQAGVAQFTDAPLDQDTINTAQVTVGTAPVLLVSNGEGVAIQAPAGATLYVGGSASVSPTTGFPVAAGTMFTVDRAPGEVIYGVLASGTGTVSVLREGV